MYERTPDPHAPREDRDEASLTATDHRPLWPAASPSARVTRGACAAWEDDGGTVLQSVDDEARSLATRGQSSDAVSSGEPHPRVAFIGTYPPRRCGLATFTEDLSREVRALYPTPNCSVVAMTDEGHHYDYPSEVSCHVGEKSVEAYGDAIDELNASGIEVVSLQHEYGIFGGEAGRLVLGFYRRLSASIVTTLHTVAPNPNASQRAIMDQICLRSARLVVMSRGAAELLAKVHPRAVGKIVVVPHGVPSVPSRERAKEELSLSGRTVLLTFGLLSPGKGIEHVISALPRIVAAHPDVLYVVLGATHPRVREEHGERYRQMLEKLSHDLHVEDHVAFYDRFVDAGELTTFLGASDLYLTPYLDLDQATSGTLAYAVGAGRASISSRYRYAEELLAEGRGRLVTPGDVDGIAREVGELLADSRLRHEMERAAGRFGREMRWPVVASTYARIFEEVASEARSDRAASAAAVSRSRPADRPTAPGGSNGTAPFALARRMMGLREPTSGELPMMGAVLSGPAHLELAHPKPAHSESAKSPRAKSSSASSSSASSSSASSSSASSSRAELPSSATSESPLETGGLLRVVLRGREASASSSRRAIPFDTSSLPSALSALSERFPSASPSSTTHAIPPPPAPWRDASGGASESEHPHRVRSLSVGAQASESDAELAGSEAAFVPSLDAAFDGVGAPHDGDALPVLRKRRRLPEVDLTHVRAMTDDTGMLQHAAWCIPRREHGYCLDDNARALLLCTRLGDHASWEIDVPGLSSRYLSFVEHAFDATRGRFRNFMTYGRRWTEAVGSEDSHGRALWSLGAAIAHSTGDGNRALAADLFARALPVTTSFTSPRAWAYTLLGLEERADAGSQFSEAHRIQVELASMLLRAFRQNESLEWPWFEDRLAYANARLPQAMMLAGRSLEDDEMITGGLRALDWLCTTQQAMCGRFSPVGSNGFYVRGDVRAEFDQQPIEASGMISACLTAHRITSDELWRDRANRAFDWFLGANHLGQWLYDPATGGCRDGIHEDRLNQNQGAESTLSFLLAVMDMRALELREIGRRTSDFVASGIASYA